MIDCIHEDSDRACLINLLSLEYQTLRSELLVRVSGRFQFLGLMTTASALLATGVFSGSVFTGQKWLVGILATTVFAFGLINFWVLGRHVLVLSRRIAEIEDRINGLAPLPTGASVPLSWESSLQQNSFYHRLTLGFLVRRV